MTLSSLVYRLATWLAPREIARKVASGLLGRDDAAEAHVQGFAQDRSVSRLIDGVVGSEPFRQRFISKNAELWVDAMFRALLQRAPTDVERREQVAALSLNPNAAEWLQALIASKVAEFRTQVFEANREPLIDALYRGLLGRHADAQGLASCLIELQGAPDLSMIVQGLVNSDEYRNHLSDLGLFRFRNEDLVNAIYTPLLGRPADPLGLATYAPKLRGAAEVSQLVHSLTRSEEYRQRMAERAIESPAAQAANQASGMLARRTGRAPTLQEISQALAYGEAFGRGLAAMSAAISRPRPQGQIKVLLFGAFGNGNLGDAYQAMAVREHVMTCWGLASSQVFATSVLASADYAFPAEQKLGKNALFNPTLLTEFDCLVIGGGGLLAHPHAPLFDEGWVRQVQIPIVILAIGATSSSIDRHRALLNKAWLVSARDVKSLAAIRMIRDDVTLVRDPILTAASLAALRACDCATQAPATPAEVLWVLKHPTNVEETRVLRQLVGVLADATERTHLVIAIEPHLDRALEEFFPGQVHYASDLTSIAPCFEQASLVITMRYHGAIFATMAGRPSIGYAQEKIRALYSEVGAEGDYDLTPTALRTRIRQLPVGAPRGAFARSGVRQTFQERFRAAGECVWPAVLADADVLSCTQV
jgi:polysaccharide pyruvyl transferase WcaK-like protein